jgi:DNA-binding NtrC family response regulator
MKTILVVDDDTTILQVIFDALEDHYKVHLAESVAKAEEVITQNGIDLLITDLVMPDKNGIDMIMASRKQYPAMKIMAISGGGGITGRFDYLPIAKLVGAEITIKKPFSIAELRKNVSRLIGN